jgi:voltage-gated potassium channel
LGVPDETAEAPGPVGADRSKEQPVELAPDPDDEPTARERVAAVVEDRLDYPMAFLALVWAVFVAYELVAPDRQRATLTLVGNVIWGVFVVEFVLKLAISGHPVRFLRRRWPSILFLALPALRIFRVIRAVRALRVLPAARVVGSSYRTIGTARSLLGERLGFLVVMSAVVVFSGGQLLYLVEGDAGGQVGSLGDALWWSANLALTGNIVFDPETLLGRLLSLVLGIYAVVVFASIAATLGAFFMESRAERAAAEDAAEAATAAGG